MLEHPNSNLETLSLRYSNTGNAGAITFANAMARNRKLKTLNLFNNGVTTEGWSSFSKILCDTSSINKTFLSNHTLESLGWSPNIPTDVASSLALNESNEDKMQVAMEKILKHHQHFDMELFFQWDLKVLPIAINWFDRARSVARSIENVDEAGIGNHKLGAIYQFIRAMPEIFEPTPATAGGGKRKRSAVDGHA